VGNAVKFTDSGSVSVRAQSLEQAGGRAVLLLEVQDTGVGIQEDLQSVVFEPFTQGEAVFTKRFQGTGLGLTIVRRLAALMDGGITLDSRPGQGTCITLALRLGQSRRKAKLPSGDNRPGTLPPLRLLLVEDNIISQMAAKSYLVRAGHEVVTALNGQEALDAESELSHMALADQAFRKSLFERAGIASEYHDFFFGRRVETLFMSAGLCLRVDARLGLRVQPDPLWRNDFKPTPGVFA